MSLESSIDVKRKGLEQQENNEINNKVDKATLRLRFSDASNNKDKYQLLKHALTSSNIELQKEGVKLVRYFEGKEKKELQSMADQIIINFISSNDPEKVIMGASIFDYASESTTKKALNEMRSKIENYLDSDSFTKQEIGSKLIRILPDKQNEYNQVLQSLIESKLSSNNEEEAVKLIQYLPGGLMSEFITKVLKKDNEQAKEVAIKYIKRFPPHTAERLIRHVFNPDAPTAREDVNPDNPFTQKFSKLNSSFKNENGSGDDLNLKKIAAEITNKVYRTEKNDADAPDDICKAITNTVENAIKSDKEEDKKIGADMLKYIQNSEDLLSIIKIGSNSEEDYLKKKSIEAIRYLPDNDGFKKERRNLISEILNSNNNITDKKEAVISARYLPYPEKEKCMEDAYLLVKELINSNDRSKQKKGAEIAYHVNYPKMQEVFSFIETDSELLKILLISRINSEGKDLSSGTDDIEVEKTGAKMIVSLADKIEDIEVSKKIKKTNFLAWLRACEEEKVWSNNGFDYVPVEPINTFKFDKHSATVETSFFDIDLDHWLNLSGDRFKKKLESKRNQIIEILSKELDIRHGDLHEGNFFLRFSRKEDGAINTEEAPRLYIGDFDTAQLKLDL